MPLIVALGIAVVRALGELTRIGGVRDGLVGGRWRIKRTVALGRTALEEGFLLACGPISRLPLSVQSREGNTEGRELDRQEEESEAALAKSRKRVMKLTLGVAAFATDIGRVDQMDKTFTEASRVTKLMFSISVVMLIYLSGATLVLSTIRMGIGANGVVDDLLWWLALTGLAVSVQATVILLWKLHTISHDLGTVPEHDMEKRIDPPLRRLRSSPITITRFGGLVHGININNPFLAVSTRFPQTLGRIGPFDTLAATIIFQQIVYTRSMSAEHPQLATLGRIAASAMLVGWMPFLWLLIIVPMAVLLTLTHLAMRGVAPDSRLTESLQSFSAQLESTVLWVKTQYKRLPDMARWVLGKAYFALWIICVYVACYVIVSDEILKLDARKHLRANNFPCMELWRDPLAELLLWPLFEMGTWAGAVFSPVKEV